MELFTPKGVEKVRKICANANLTASWQEDDGHTYRFTIPQREALLKEGLPAFRSIEQSYKELDHSVPGGHHQYLEVLVYDFLRDEVLIALDENDFHAECHMFWDLLEEKGKSNRGEVVSEMIYEIRAFVIEHALLNLNLNLEVLLTRKDKIYMVPDALSWDAMQLKRAKKDINKWIYLPFVRERSYSKKLRDLHASLIGTDDFLLYKKELLLEIPIAKDFKDYLKKYPKGIDEYGKNCIKVSYRDGSEPDYLELHPFAPMTSVQTRAIEDMSFLDAPLYGIEEFSIAPLEENIKTLKSLGEAFEVALKREISHRAKGMAETYLEHREFEMKDIDDRNMLHWALFTEDKELIYKLYKIVTDAGKAHVFYDKDKYGQSVYGLCCEYMDTNKETGEYLLSLLYRDHIDLLPNENETANNWKTVSSLKGERGDQTYWIIEKRDLVNSVLDSSVYALNVNSEGATNFVTFKLSGLDNLIPLAQSVSAEVYLDGTYWDAPF